MRLGAQAPQTQGPHWRGAYLSRRDRAQHASTDVATYPGQIDLA